MFVKFSVFKLLSNNGMMSKQVIFDLQYSLLVDIENVMICWLVD